MHLHIVFYNIKHAERTSQIHTETVDNNGGANIPCYIQVSLLLYYNFPAASDTYCSRLWIVCLSSVEVVGRLILSA